MRKNTNLNILHGQHGAHTQTQLYSIDELIEMRVLYTNQWNYTQIVGIMRTQFHTCIESAWKMCGSDDVKGFAIRFQNRTTR